MKKHNLILVLIALMFVVASCKKGDLGPTGSEGLAGTDGISVLNTTGTVIGFVQLNDENWTRLKDFSGVSVSVSDTTLKATTDIDGRFEIKNLKRGIHNFIFTKAGYGTIQVQNILYKALRHYPLQ